MNRHQLTALILSLFLTLLVSPVSRGDLVLEGGTVFPSPYDAPIENAIVMIANGKIIAVANNGDIAIPDNAVRINLHGKIITAGFWNSHVHFLPRSSILAENNRDQLQNYLVDLFLRWGFVNTVDTGSDFSVTRRIQQLIQSDFVLGPNIFTMGGSFVPVGGSPFYIKPVTLPEFTSSSIAKQFVQQGLDAGLDGIKIFTGSWATPERVVLMIPEHVRAATEKAHQNNALVFAHPSDSDGARIAINNGVDVLAHTFPAELKGPWDKSLPAAMVARDVALIPTLKLFRVDLERIGLPTAIVNRIEANAVAQTAAVHKAGGTILFGTDVGYMDDTDTKEEYRLMALAGLDYKSILHSLTTTPSKMYGMENNHGKVAAGFAADLVVLATDPRQEITAFADVEITIRNGVVVFSR